MHMAKAVKHKIMHFISAMCAKNIQGTITSDKRNRSFYNTLNIFKIQFLTSFKTAKHYTFTEKKPQKP